MNDSVKRFLLIFSITLLIGLLLFGILFGGTILGYWGSVDDLDIDSLTLRQNSSLIYLDEDGNEVEFYSLNAEENRIWADMDQIPEYLGQAFVSIEDERFYQHRGFDLRRTVKATLTWIGDKITRREGAGPLWGEVPLPNS